MFAKLLKHEIKSTGGLLGILSAASLSLAVLGGFLIRFSINSAAGEEATIRAFSIASAVALPLIFLSLFAYVFGSEIYLIVQFYKRKYTDQGYLTFTLPVATWKIYVTSLLNMMMWMFIIAVVAIVSFLSLYLIGIYDSEIWQILTEAGTEISEIFDFIDVELGAWGIISPVVSFISSNVLMITGITIGCVVARKHKILASIGFYYLISMAISSIATILNVSLMFNSADIQMNQIYMGTSIMHMVAIVAGSVLTVWLMDKKLNLP